MTRKKKAYVWDLPPAPHTAGHQKGKPNRVDPLGNDDDFATLLLGAAALHGSAIRRNTGYSEGQISYRLRKYGISRRDIRDGKSPFSDVMIKAATPALRIAIASRVRHDNKKNGA